MRKKENWVPIYRDKGKTRQAWASLDGSDVVEERPHSDGPSNEAVRAATQATGSKKIISVPSHAFMEGWDRIFGNRKEDHGRT